MYKVIFDSINSTQDEIISFNNYKKILKNNNLYIQSFRQTKGTGRGKKKWLSPTGNIGIGININNSPIVDSVSLFGIINKKSNILDLSNIIIDFIEHNLTKKISNKKLVRYLNQYMFRDFKLNHPIFGKNIIEILSVNEDLSLKIKIDDATKNIFFGELV